MLPRVEKHETIARLLNSTPYLMIISRAGLSRIAQSRITLIVAMTAIVVVASLDVMYAAYYSVLDYDLGKVISYISFYPGLLNYIKGLNFGQGIAIQMYAIHQVVPLTPAILKLGSYLFFVAALVAPAIQAGVRQKRASDTVIVTTVVAIGLILFLQSSALRYLGSYGMLVYCQSLFISALFLYFLRRFLFAGHAFSFRVLALWLPVFFIGTIIDVRFSFYLCLAFGVAVLCSIGDRRLLMRTIAMGSVTGIVISIPIFTQFTLYSELASFRPHHVHSYFYVDPFTFAEVVHFVTRNINNYIETLGGNHRYLKVALVLLSIIGMVSQWREPAGRKLVMFTVATIALLIIASLLNVYPFGSVRYTTQFFAFPVYFVACGTVFVTTRLFTRISNRIIKATLWLGLVCSVAWLHESEVALRIALSSQLSDREIKLVEELREIPRGNLWCDSATQKMVLGYGLECKLVATWNYQTGKSESPEFYAQVDKGLSKMSGTGAIFLFRKIEIPFFEPIRGMLTTYELELVDSYHGRSKNLYIFRAR